MNKKKLLALLMALVMTLTLVPVTALAEFNSSSVTWDYSLQNDYYEDVTSATIGVGNVVNAWISSDTDGYKVSSAVSSDVSVARLVDYTYEADGDGHWNVKVQEDWIQPWNENGELYIEGVSEGTAYIEQTIVDENDAFVDKVAFTVIVGDSIFVSANQVSITEGYTKADAVIGTPFTLHAVVSPENATYNTVTWSTADASVATISQDGNTVTVTPVAVGTVGITATCDGPNPHSAVCSITVTAPAPVESGAVRVYNGDTFVSGHATLAEAINAAQSGDTVKLFEDVAVSSSTSLSKSLILDLNGHTINSSATLFNMYSSVVELTIKDSGGNGAIDVAAEKGIYVSSGKLTLESGALEVHSSNSYTYGVQVGSSGTFVMTGGSITIPTSSTSTYNYPVNNSGTVNISGGAITAHGSGGNYAVNSSGGTVTISGGSFEAHAYAAGFKSPYVLYGSGS